VNEKPKYIWSHPAASVLPRLKHAESLDGLAESHVVRQAAAETDSLEEVDPTKTDLLVFPQVALESGYGCYGPDRIEVLKRIPQLGEGAVQVEVRFGRQKRVEESRLRSPGSGRAAISRRMIRSGLSLVKPSPRFLGLRLFTSRTVSAGRRKKKEGRRKKEEGRSKEEGRRIGLINIGIRPAGMKSSRLKRRRTPWTRPGPSTGQPGNVRFPTGQRQHPVPRFLPGISF